MALSTGLKNGALRAGSLDCSLFVLYADGMNEALADKPRKGRGAVGNPTGRFEAGLRVATDDGWGLGDEEPAPLRTTLGIDSTRRIITRNQSPDVPFDRSINPYKGCEHGCIYCFARPTHAYLGHSPGLDFETKLYLETGCAGPAGGRAARPEISRRDPGAGRQYRPLPADRAGPATDPTDSARCWPITATRSASSPNRT